jgi:hypothetical protein
VVERVMCLIERKKEAAEMFADEGIVKSSRNGKKYEKAEGRYW